MTTTTTFQVSFPRRESSVPTTIVRTEPLAQDSYAVMTACTPFHPVDFTWPDQPADHGTMTVGSLTLDVADCVTGAIHKTDGQLLIGDSITIRKSDEHWSFVVVHLFENCTNPELLKPGTQVTLEIDAHYQQQLSLGHTACHLSAMALNRAAAPFWRKQPLRRDALDSPDFDQMAIFSSKIQPGGSRDHYRLGKTIRKKGLRSEEVIKDLPQLMSATEQQVNNWLALESQLYIECEGRALTDRRFWHCDLGEDGKAVIPCGGTHARSLKELGAVRVSAEPISDNEFVMVTEVIGPQ